MTSDSVTCPVCNRENLAGSLVCEYCLSALYLNPTGVMTTIRMPEQQKTESADLNLPPLDLVAQDRLCLVIENTPVATQIEPGQAFILGRDHGGPGPNGEFMVDLAAFQAFDRGVSRRHLLVQPVEDGYEICDLESTNGTWMNKSRLMPGRFYPIHEADSIYLGHLCVRVVPPRPPAPPA